jgi:hypothetical protein
MAVEASLEWLFPRALAPPIHSAALTNYLKTLTISYHIAGDPY